MAVGIIISCSDRRLESAPSRARGLLRKMEYEVGDEDTYRIQIPGSDGECCGVLGEDFQSVTLKQVRILVERAHIEFIVIIGHSDCAGNTCADEVHIRHVQSAAELLMDQFNLPAIGFFDQLVSNRWQLKEICHLKVIE
jgi:hypothetical protein